MERIIIVAATRNRVIGKDNDLIWHLPVDMNFFKESTRGYPVIMGRKNYESIPEKYRPLPGRKNIVLSRQTDFQVAEQVALCQELEESMSIAQKEGKDKVFIIGGGQIYKSALEKGLVDTMLITWIDTELEGDAYFPEFNEQEWKKQRLMKHPQDDKHAYSMDFIEYKRISKEA